MIVKTVCGCTWLALAHDKYLQLSDCCDEHSEVFLSAMPRESKDMDPITERHNLDSLIGLKWIDRLSSLIVMGNLYMKVARVIHNLNNVEPFRGLPS